MSIDINKLIESAPAKRRNYLRNQCIALIEADKVFLSQMSVKTDKIVSLKTTRENRRNGKRS